MAAGISRRIRVISACSFRFCALLCRGTDASDTRRQACQRGRTRKPTVFKASRAGQPSAGSGQDHQDGGTVAGQERRSGKTNAVNPAKFRERNRGVPRIGRHIGSHGHHASGNAARHPGLIAGIGGAIIHRCNRRAGDDPVLTIGHRRGCCRVRNGKRSHWRHQCSDKHQDGPESAPGHSANCAKSFTKFPGSHLRSSIPGALWSPSCLDRGGASVPECTAVSLIYVKKDCSRRQLSGLRSTKCLRYNPYPE